MPQTIQFDVSKMNTDALKPFQTRRTGLPRGRKSPSKINSLRVLYGIVGQAAVKLLTESENIKTFEVQIPSPLAAPDVDRLAFLTRQAPPPKFRKPAPPPVPEFRIMSEGATTPKIRCERRFRGGSEVPTDSCAL